MIVKFLTGIKKLPGLFPKNMIVKILTGKKKDGIDFPKSKYNI